MSTKGAFVDSLITKGFSDNEILEEMKKYRAKNGAFDDEQQKAPSQNQEKRETQRFFVPDKNNPTGFRAVNIPDDYNGPQQQKRGLQPGQRRFFGLPENAERAIFPRAVETRESGGGPIRTAIPGAMDIISIPGRAIAATPAGLTPSGETFTESFSRKEALPRKGLGKIGEFVGNVARDPFTALSYGAGAATAPIKTAGLPLLKKAGISAVRSAGEQIVPAVTRQIEQSSRTGKVNAPQQAKEIASEVGMGIVGGAVGESLPVASSKFGERLMRGVQKTKDKTAKLAGGNVDKGVKNIVNDIVEFKLESPMGNFGKMAENANKQIGVESKKLDNVLQKFTDENPDVTVNIDKVFNKYIDDINSGKEDLFFGPKKEGAASEQANEILEGLKKRGLSGEQPVSKLREIKQRLRDSLKLFKKGKFQVQDDAFSTQVGDLALLRVNEQLDKYIPEAKKLNDNMRRLYTTRDALMEANKRSTNNNFISLRQGIAGALGISAGMPGETIAALIALKALQEGRGPSTLIKLGRFGQENVGTVSNISKVLGAETSNQKIKDLFKEENEEENTTSAYLK